MKNTTFSVLLIALLCLSPCLCQFRSNPKIDHYNSLNESVKAVLGAVLGNIDNISDSSDDGLTDDADNAYMTAGLRAEPEDKLRSPHKIEDIFNDAFGMDNRFFEGLMEMVAVNIENLHDHANKFIDIYSNETKDMDFPKEDLVESFKDFHKVITKIIDQILDETPKIDDDEYIVSSHQSAGDISKVEDDETKESSGNEEFEKEDSQKLKDGFKTITFIKNRLARNKHVHPSEKKSHSERGEKTLRRQNAMKPKEMEKILRDLDKMNENEYLQLQNN